MFPELVRALLEEHEARSWAERPVPKALKGASPQQRAQWRQEQARHDARYRKAHAAADAAWRAVMGDVVRPGSWGEWRRLLMHEGLPLEPRSEDVPVPPDDVLQALRLRFTRAMEQKTPAEPNWAGTEANALLAPSDLAKRFNVPLPALKKRLVRYRKEHLDGWQEISDRGAHQPGFVYRYGAVLPILKDLHTRTAAAR